MTIERSRQDKNSKVGDLLSYEYLFTQFTRKYNEPRGWTLRNKIGNVCEPTRCTHAMENKIPRAPFLALQTIDFNDPMSYVIYEPTRKAFQVLSLSRWKTEILYKCL